MLRTSFCMWVPKGRTELLVQPTTPNNNSYPLERQGTGLLKARFSTNTAINHHRLPAVLLVALFGLVVGIGLLFFAPASKSIALSAWSQPSAAAAPAAKAPASLEATTLPVRAELSNDLDHDGKPDGMADALAVLAPLLVGGVSVLLRFIPLRIRPLVDNTYLLPLYKELKPGAVYYAPLERPG